MREARIEAHFVNLVRDAGGVAFKCKAPGRRSMPDRHVRFPLGVEFYVEFKRPGERPTVAQLEMHQILRSLGATVYVSDAFSINKSIVLAEMNKVSQRRLNP